MLAMQVHNPEYRNLVMQGGHDQKSLTLAQNRDFLRNLYNNKGVWDPENDSRFPLPWKFKRQVAESRLVPYNQLAQTLDYQPYNQKTKELHAKAKYWQNVEELWKGPVSNLARNIKNSYLGMHEQIITDPTNASSGLKILQDVDKQNRLCHSEFNKM